MVSSLPPLRVLIVADDPLARAGLAAMLTGVPDCRVVGQSRGDGDVVTALEVYRPDVVLWDMGWEPLSAAASACTHTWVRRPLAGTGTSDGGTRRRPCRGGVTR